MSGRGPNATLIEGVNWNPIFWAFVASVVAPLLARILDGTAVKRARPVPHPNVVERSVAMVRCRVCNRRFAVAVTDIGETVACQDCDR
jgi:hypothetical protein